MELDVIRDRLHRAFSDISSEYFQAGRGSKFSSEILKPLGDPPLRELRRTQWMQYPHLNELLEAISAGLSKFYYGRHTVSEWKRRYVFPSMLSLRAFEARLNHRTKRNFDGLIANKNRAAMQLWLQSNVFDDLSRGGKVNPKLALLLGPVGSGKSTFVKYLLNVSRDQFIERKIIPTRIEARKTLLEFQERQQFPGDGTNIGGFLDKFRDYIVRNLFRDVLHFVYDRTVDGATFESPADAISSYPCIFKPEFEAYCRGLPSNVRSQFGRHDPCEHIRRIVRDILRLDQSQRAVAIPDILSGPEAPYVTSAIVGFYAERGVRYALFFDGFDFIELGDFVFRTPQRCLFELLELWLNGVPSLKLHCPPHITVQGPKCVVSLRYSTHSELTKHYSQATSANVVRTWHYIAPPSMAAYFGVFLRQLGNQFGLRRDVGLLRSELYRLLRVIQLAVCRDLELDARENLADVFNDNVRHQINFACDVIEEIVDDCLRVAPKKNDTRVSELARLFRHEVDVFIGHRQYRLVDLLLCSASNRFTNFVRVTDTAQLRQALRQKETALLRPHDLVVDNNYDSGYVSNIFNYHLEYENINQLYFLIEKPRILELLSQAEGVGNATGAGLSLRQLREGFEENGWLPSHEFELSLYILVREGFAYADGTATSPVFRIMPLGRIVIQQLIARVVYLENVYFGTMLPSVLARISLDEVRNPEDTRPWVKASLFHIFLLLKLVHQAESWAIPNSSVKPRGFLLARMQSPVLKSIDAIVGRDLRTTKHFEQSISQGALTLIEGSRLFKL